MTVNQLAGELYETYCLAVGNKPYNGDMLPTWHALTLDQSKQKIVSAWEAVAVKVMQDWTADINFLARDS